MKLEEIVAKYKEAEKCTEIVKKEGSIGVYGYKNQALRDRLREQYISLLPLNKRVAILLHKKLCHYDHTGSCFFYYGIHGIEDDWSEYAHKHYLKMADRLVEKCQQIGVSSEDMYAVIADIVDIVSKQ